jgi:N-acetylglucosaminyldiphosphoundecaprenol N-acetyl-beta-D-mannosaminyltransferase
MCAMIQGESLWKYADGPAVPRVPVGPFLVADSSQSALVKDVVSRTVAVDSGPVLVYALHVGGLNARRNKAFVSAMHDASVVYADGGSVVGLARLAGARSIERAPTTDVGWDILQELSRVLDRPVRVALVGGPFGLAERAGRALTTSAPVRVVLTDHGYHRDWSGSLHNLRQAGPDVVLVGMGSPGEMIWCEENRQLLPASLVLTCGGWFGHLGGDERRAPRILRRSGIEWVARVAQAPRRLGPRYARGICSSLALGIPAWRHRATSPSS